MKKIVKRRYCCERFKDAVEEEYFQYAYDHSSKIDETQWIIAGVAHIYYCPFCGKFIKGRGFGNYDESYPPDRFSKKN